jgi:hypothetical protein
MPGEGAFIAGYPAAPSVINAQSSKLARAALAGFMGRKTVPERRLEH